MLITMGKHRGSELYPGDTVSASLKTLRPRLLTIQVILEATFRQWLKLLTVQKAPSQPVNT